MGCRNAISSIVLVIQYAWFERLVSKIDKKSKSNRTARSYWMGSNLFDWHIPGRTTRLRNDSLSRSTTFVSSFSYPITGVSRLRANADQAFDHVPNIWAKDSAEGFREFKATDSLYADADLGFLESVNVDSLWLMDRRWVSTDGQTLT